MNTSIYSKNESYARPDGQVKRYHSALITEVGEVCRSRLPQFVRAEDFDRVTAERDQLQRDLDARDQSIDLMADVDHLSNIIRKVDGNHSLGAGALAQAIIDELENKA